VLVCVDDDDYSGGMGNLGLGGGANGAGSFSDAHSRARSGVVEVDIRDIELEADKKAQGGLGVLYKGVWRGCEVAVKRPVDPRSAMDPELKEDFRREVDILSEVRHPNVVLLMGVRLPVTPGDACVCASHAGTRPRVRATHVLARRVRLHAHAKTHMDTHAQTHNAPTQPTHTCTLIPYIPNPKFSSLKPQPSTQACQRGTNLCIVLEWCQGGSLFDVVHRRQSDLPKEQRLRLATGAMAGMKKGLGLNPKP